MKLLFLTLTLFFCMQQICFAGIFSYIVSPAPARAQDSAYWMLQFNLPVGMLGVTKSCVPGRQVDARILNCIGFGPSYQRQVWSGKNYTTFGITTAMLFFPRMDEDAFPWDIGVGTIMTAFGGYGIGIAYNAGKVQGKTINRIIGLLIADVIPWKNK